MSAFTGAEHIIREGTIEPLSAILVVNEDFDVWNTSVVAEEENEEEYSGPVLSEEMWEVCFGYYSFGKYNLTFMVAKSRRSFHL